MGAKIKDENNTQKYLQVVEELATTKLQIGIFAKDSKGEKPNIMMLAMVHEYGIDIKVTEKMRAYLHSQGMHLKKDTKKIKIPERSFIRGGFDTNQKNINREVEKLLPKVLDLKLSVKAFYNTIGALLVGMIEEYMTDLSDPPNHPYTVKKKGSSNPLINTGDLRQRITYKVLRRGEQ